MLKVKVESGDKFHIIMETLSRIGVTKKETNQFFQSTYIVKIENLSYLVYYKEILGKEMKPLDYARLGTIAKIVQGWGMFVVLDNDKMAEYGFLPSVSILSFEDKKKWEKVENIGTPELKKFISYMKNTSQLPRPEGRGLSSDAQRKS